MELELADWHLDRWMDRPTDGQIDGWTDRQMDGQMDAPMDRQTNIPSYRDAWMHLKRTRPFAISCVLQVFSNRRTDQQTDRPTNQPTNQPTNRLTERLIDLRARNWKWWQILKYTIFNCEKHDGHLDGWMDRPTDGWIDGWTDRQMDGWKDKSAYRDARTHLKIKKWEK